MKKLCLLIAALSVISANAQTSVYHPFPENNATWNIGCDQGMCAFGGFINEEYSITMAGDTTINNQVYHKLATPFVEVNLSGNCTQLHFAAYRGAIRQDESLRKVFYMPPAATTDQLLYDFTLEVGDTVSGYLQGFLEPADTVVAIDSVLVGDNYRKRWLINPCYEIYLIEGIGSTFGLLEPSPGCMTDMDYYSMNCCSLEGQAIYPSGLTECKLITGIANNPDFSNQVHVYPNPSKGTFTIELSQPNDYKEISIADIPGNIVFRKEIANQQTVNIDNLPVGTYILTIIDKGNRTYNKKIVRVP